MAIITDSAYIDLLAIIVTIVVGLVTYVKRSFKYWEKKNMPYLEPSFPFGTMENPIRNPQAIGEMNRQQYNECRAKGYKHVGLYAIAKPVYMPVDPEYVKNVLIRDFDHFVDRGMYYDENVDPLSAHLFAVEGAKWRNLRVKLTPTFTSGKMKMMFQTLTDCGVELEQFMGKVKNEPVNIKDVVGCFTTNVIGSCAFGLNCNSFEDPNSEFRTRLKRVFNNTTWEKLKGTVAFNFPSLGKSLGVAITPQEVSEFVLRVIKETVEFREKNNFVRNDFMQLLLDLKNKVTKSEGEYQHDGKSLTLNELAAQAYIFLLAGYETSATTMTFCLFELALNPDIQQRVREEINSVLENHDGKITYDAVMEMKYMGQVVDETLRMYPPVPVLFRSCVTDYKVPGTDVTVEKGTFVLVPVIGLQHDETYFPDPETFDPERFSDENKSKINPLTYMPFGEGPRICIGVRFGVMQTKVGLAALLKNYVFSLNDKTKVPLQYDSASFILSALGDIWLNVESVKQ